MVKAPSQHGLDRKYRSWRKGKSAKAKKQGSLKHQLRGQERLLAKLEKQHDQEERITTIRAAIDSLKQEISRKENQEQQREHAKKSHGTRFLERQRLTRLEKTARKSKDEKELKRIALDQIYVAHYPLDKAYRLLFRNGQRWMTHSVSRAQLRHKVLQDLKQNKIQRCKWIPSDQYDRLPETWSVQEEVELFKYPTGSISREAAKNKNSVSQDDRFAMKSNHEKVLQAAQDLESKLNKEENKREDKEKAKDKDSSSDSDSDSSNSDSSNEEEDKPKVSATSKKSEPQEKGDSDSSDTDSSDDEEEKLKAKISATSKKSKPQEQDQSDSSSSCSSSSSSSSDSDSSDSDSDSEEKPPAQQKRKPEETLQPNNEDDDGDSDDGFLVAATEGDDGVNVFDRVQQELPAENPARGDKSQGWATQQQRPGRYKKKRTRH